MQIKYRIGVMPGLWPGGPDGGADFFWRFVELCEKSSIDSVWFSAGPDEETVRIARKDFRRRRHAGKWRVVRYVLLALLLVAAVAGAVWVVFFSSYVTVRAVTVTGNPTLTETRVERAADVPMNTPLATRYVSTRCRA